MEHEALMKSKVPTELTVTIQLKWVDSIKAAKLDINEETVLFEYPDLYYLDLNLKYKTDPSSGSAKFDKSKHVLTIRLPVVGLTEDSQKVMDEHYRKHVTEKEEALKNLQNQDEVKDDEPEEVDKRVEQSKGSDGVGSGIVKPLLDDQAGIKDDYSMEKTTEDIKKAMMDEDEDDLGDAGMLDVYKEGQEMETKLPMADLPDTKPAIEELSSVKFNEQKKKEPEPIIEDAPAKLTPFDWETAQRLEAKFTFMNRGDMVFINFNLKGYDKEKGVHYALSENEILLEVRIPGENKVAKLCQTLFQPIVVKDSKV